jgi:hypothetical protein
MRNSIGPGRNLVSPSARAFPRLAPPRELVKDAVSRLAALGPERQTEQADRHEALDAGYRVGFERSTPLFY